MVHRSDGSGTTFVWTDYLSKVSPEWKSKVGANTSVNWPVGLGGKGNEGVAGLVKQTPNSIGYVELIYAVQNKMEYGAVKNAAGNFVKADFNTVTEAAAGAAKEMPADFRVSITNAPGKNAYPISSFTWLLIPRQDRRRDQEEVDHGLLDMDADHRPEGCGRNELRPASQAGSRQGTKADRADKVRNSSMGTAVAHRAASIASAEIS